MGEWQTKITTGRVMAAKILPVLLPDSQFIFTIPRRSAPVREGGPCDGGTRQIFSFDKKEKARSTMKMKGKGRAEPPRLTSCSTTMMTTARPSPLQGREAENLPRTLRELPAGKRGGGGCACRGRTRARSASRRREVQGRMR